jgi:capsular exopolysaccharide synthesis family protein
VTLRAYLRIFRERWKLIWVIAVIAIGIAIGITAITPKSYAASAQLFVSANGESLATQGAQGSTYVQQLVTSLSRVVGNPETMNAVIKDQHLLLTVNQLKGKITADAPIGTSLLNIHVSDRNAGVAAAIANSTARAFVAYAEKITTSAGAASSSVNINLTGPATASSKPESPDVVLNLALGVILGLLLGAGSAIGRDVLDSRIKDPDALAGVAKAPVMGVVVDDPKTDRHPIATRAGNRNIRAENFRQLRANLQFANVDNHPRVIAITSSVSTEGKTTVAINLASTLAEAGFSVCLVDADLRRPSVAKVLGLVSPVGLTSVLIHQIELSEVLQHAGSSLYVLTSGPTPPNPSEVLASSYVRDVIRSLLDKVDYVIIDTAPLLPVADGSEVAALADGTLLVARAGLTTDSNVKRAVSTLARVDAKLLGVVLNRMPLRRNQNEYGYTYYRETDVPTHRGDKARRKSKA